MKIQALGYDPESDELDLLINADAPQSAEAVPLDAGVYIRRDPESRARSLARSSVGILLFCDLYLQSRKSLRQKQARWVLTKEFAAIVDWQRKALRLSHDLLAHIGSSSRKDQQVLVETLLAQTS